MSKYVNWGNYCNFFHNCGERNKERLKGGYTYQKVPGAELVYSEPDSKGGWKKTGPNTPNVYIKGGKGTLIYKLPEKKAPAPKPAPAPPPAPKPKPKPVPVQLSKEAATAIGRAAAYEDTVRRRYGDYVIGGDESVIDDFDKDAAEKIGEALKPYFDDDVDRNEAQAYADKYKLVLGKDLKLTPIAKKYV